MNHIKHLSAAALFCAVSLTVSADPIDVNQALQKVQKFRQSTAAPNGMRKAAAVGRASEITLAYTQNTTSGEPAVYVFNTGNEGYVLVSADDDAVNILGYSDTGSFDPNNIPDGMRFMIESYAQQISTLSNNPSAAAKAPARAQSTEVIQPLLGKIEWDQMPPYNLKCPIAIGGNSNGQYNGSKAATGCVTTALAQVMFYHRHPEHGYNSIEFEVKAGIGSEVWKVDLYNNYYHWESMGNNKNEFAKSGSSYNTSDPGVDGVSTLMRDLGLALRTQYGTASGASRNRLIPAVINYFDYDPETIELVEILKTGQEVFEERILQELREKRPVYMEGAPGKYQGGHAFVCDGYDGNGRFHINWGWSGISNNYFAITALNPSQQGTGSTGSGYSYDVAILCGMKPRPATQEPFNAYPISVDHVATRVGTFDSPGIWIATAEDPENDNDAYEFTLDDAGDYWYACELGVPTNKGMDVRAQFGVLVVKADGSRELAWDKDGEPTMIFNGFPYYKFRVNMKESWKKVGTRVYYIYRKRGSDKIELIRNANKQICSFDIVSKNGQPVAQINRTEPTQELDFTPTETAQKEPFFANSLNFDYNEDARRDNRRIGTIGINVAETNKTTSFSVDSRKVYRNMTDDAVFKVPAGTTIKPIVTMSVGNWMNAFFYIDYDRDGVLSYPTTLSQKGTDLAAYSYWSAGGNTFYNSAGNVVTNGDTREMPAFKAPDTPGIYYVRFKLDWNCADPGGNTATGNHIVENNGGAIVDAKLVVTEPLPEPEPLSPEMIAAIQEYRKAEQSYYDFREWAWTLQGAAFNVAAEAIQATDFYIGWVADDTTIQQYNNATNQINTKLGDARKRIYEMLGITPDPDPETDPETDSALVAARTAYNQAVTSYEALVEEYSNTSSSAIATRIALLTTDLGTSLNKGETATKDELIAATSTITSKVEDARTDIARIKQEEEMSEQDKEAFHNAALSDLSINYGTTKLQMYPAEFDPNVHLYLARRTNATWEYDMAGSCLLYAGYNYTIVGTPANSNATVSEAVTIRPLSGWNRVTITCTAPDGVTKDAYHVILIGDGNNSGAVDNRQPTATDLSFWVQMMQPDYGYREFNPSDSYFNKMLRMELFDYLVNKILKK